MCQIYMYVVLVMFLKKKKDLLAFDVSKPISTYYYPK